MPDYRLYHLDGAGCVKVVEWLDAPGDENAIAAAKFHDMFAQCEVWQGRRLVTRLGRGLAVDQPPALLDAPVRLPHPAWASAGPDARDLQ